eukprot:11228057-Lingulodinium_polyedra.AAC.1
MQAALRAAVQELSRSAVTSLLVWASGTCCPDCRPEFSCPSYPRLPDCICQGGERVIPVGGPSWKFLGFVGLIIFVL